MKEWWRRLEPRFKKGVYASVVWLVLGLTYAWLIYGWKQFWELPPNSVGDFFAGLSAPLAFLWLVLGYMQQGEEIKETRVEIKRQADSIEANEAHARRDTFFRFSEIITGQIVSITANLALSGTGRDNKDRWMQTYQAGDQYVFFDLVLSYLRQKGLHIEWNRKFLEDIGHQARVDQYIKLYETLIIEAEKSDSSATIPKAYQQSSMGDLYFEFCQIKDRRPRMVGDGSGVK